MRKPLNAGLPSLCRQLKTMRAHAEQLQPIDDDNDAKRTNVFVSSVNEKMIYTPITYAHVYYLCKSNYLCRICAASSRSCAESSRFVQRGKACVDGRFERFVIPCAVLCAFRIVRARDKAKMCHYIKSPNRRIAVGTVSSMKTL